MVAVFPHGEREVNVTVVLIFLFVLLVMKPMTPTVVPGVVVVGDTLMLKPTLEPCALVGAGTNSNVKQTSIMTLLIK